ncbi:MAG: flagellar hook-basal body complex protein [Thermodesulfobacteriota bacterium]
MISGISSALSGLQVHQAMVQAAAGNLANLNTTGFKSSRVNLGTLGAGTTAAGEIGRGAQVLSAQRDFSPGPLLSTGQDLDLAIQGDGFFRVNQNGQAAYTRDGSFHLDRDGYVVDASGNRLQPEMQLPSETASIRVSPSGRLEALDAGGQVIATENLQLSRFPNPNGLISIGQNDYLPSAASGEPQAVTPGTEGVGTVIQGALEGAQVDPAREMVNLMLGQRGFEASLKVIQTTDTLLGELVDVRA